MPRTKSGAAGCKMRMLSIVSPDVSRCRRRIYLHVLHVLLCLKGQRVAQPLAVQDPVSDQEGVDRERVQLCHRRVSVHLTDKPGLVLKPGIERNNERKPIHLGLIVAILNDTWAEVVAQG